MRAGLEFIQPNPQRLGHCMLSTSQQQNLALWARCSHSTCHHTMVVPSSLIEQPTRFPMCCIQHACCGWTPAGANQQTAVGMYSNVLLCKEASSCNKTCKQHHHHRTQQTRIHHYALCHMLSAVHQPPAGESPALSRGSPAPALAVPPQQSRLTLLSRMRKRFSPGMEYTKPRPAPEVQLLAELLAELLNTSSSPSTQRGLAKLSPATRPSPGYLGTAAAQQAGSATQ